MISFRLRCDKSSDHSGITFRSAERRDGSRQCAHGWRAHLPNCEDHYPAHRHAMLMKKNLPLPRPLPEPFHNLGSPLAAGPKRRPGRDVTGGITGPWRCARRGGHVLPHGSAARLRQMRRASHVHDYVGEEIEGQRRIDRGEPFFIEPAKRAGRRVEG